MLDKARIVFAKMGDQDARSPHDHTHRRRAYAIVEAGSLKTNQRSLDSAC